MSNYFPPRRCIPERRNRGADGVLSGQCLELWIEDQGAGGHQEASGCVGATLVVDVGSCLRGEECSIRLLGVERSRLATVAAGGEIARSSWMIDPAGSVSSPPSFS